MDNIEFVEKYAIMLLGVNERLMPSKIHLHKEMFILTNMKPDIKKHFDFEKHYIGPFSQTLHEVVEDPVFVPNAFVFQHGKIGLRENGKKEFNNILKEYQKNDNFKKVLMYLNLIRELYDKLNSKELLFLVYETYPDYTEFSDYSDRLLKNAFLRNKIIESLFSKGMITEKRYSELKRKR
jgi:hypothetical protein